MFRKISSVSFVQSSRLRISRNFATSFRPEIVETEYGPIRGDERLSVLGRKYFNFQGIPFMKAPLGKFRFRDAEAPAKWSEPLDVTKEPPGYCMRSFLNYADGGREDAAIVNVYTPYTNPQKPLPVMFWIHGGGWNSGSGQTDLFGPDYFMQQDVVLVTVNYRLGPIGFLSLEDPEVNIPGNAGLKDQTFALKWVQRNIERFGGDPNNVTVFGESAGGGSTHYHMISDHSKNLFHKAIPMSGNAFCKAWASIPRKDWHLRLAKHLGYQGRANDKDILEFLEKPNGAALVQAVKRVLTFEEEIGMHILYAFGPTVEPYVTENCFIPEDPVKMAGKAWSKDMHMMIGATSNEGILRANCDADKISALLQDFRYFAPLVQLGIDLKSEKAVKYGKKMKNLYYGETLPSIDNQQPYLDFISDAYFWHGIDSVLQSRSFYGGAGKNFLYRFDVDLSQNFVKKAHVEPHDIGKYPGASHCDELPYLFKTGPDTKIPSPTIDSKEFDVIKMMVETFTTFAATGDPNNETIDEWKEFNSNDLHLKCLNFNENGAEMINLPEESRIKVWNEIFAEENVELFSKKILFTS